MEPSISSVVGRGTFYLAVTTVVLKIASLVSVLLVLNYLTVREYGIAELVITLVPLLSLFLLPGLNTTVIADAGIEKARGNYAGVKGLLLNYLQLQSLFAVCVWVAVFFGASMLATWYGKGNLAPLIQIVSFGFLLSPLRSFVQVFQRVYLQFSQQSVFSVLEEAWKLALLGFFFFGLHWRVEGLLAAAVLSQALALICILPYFLRIDRSLWRVTGERLRFWHFLYLHGKWGVFSTYLGTVGKNIRPWIIGFFLGTEAVGLYAVVMGLVGHATSLFPLEQVMSPVLPQYLSDKERFYRLIAKAVKYQFLGYALISIPAAFFSPWFFAWLFPQYVPAVPLFQVMLLLLTSIAFDAIFSGAFYALRAQRSLFFASVYKLLLTALLTPVFLIFFGFFGIAYAVITINYLYVFERYITLKRLLPGFRLRARDFFTIDEYDQFVIKKFSQALIRIFKI